MKSQQRVSELEEAIRDMRWVGVQHDGSLAAAIVARCDSALASQQTARPEFGMFDNGDGTATLRK